MAVGHQDHGRIAMPVAAMLAGTVHQSLDLALGEVASFNCQVFDGWSAFPGSRFHRNKNASAVRLVTTLCAFLAQLKARRRQPRGWGWVDPPGGGRAKIENSSVGQRCAALALCPQDRQHHVTCAPRWTSSPLLSSLSFWYIQGSRAFLPRS